MGRAEAGWAADVDVLPSVSHGAGSRLLTLQCVAHASARRRVTPNFLTKHPLPRKLGGSCMAVWLPILASCARGLLYALRASILPNPPVSIKLEGLPSPKTAAIEFVFALPHASLPSVSTATRCSPSLLQKLKKKNTDKSGC